MLDFPLHECSLHVDKANAQAMVRGFIKDGRVHHLSILTDKGNGNYLRLWRYSYNLPRLLTPFKEHTKYQLSSIGIPLESYPQFDLKYISFLDTVIHLKKTGPKDTGLAEMWKDLCFSGIFDIWDPGAPMLNLRSHELPMILMVRVCEIEQEFAPEELSGKRFLKFIDPKPRTVRVLRPIIENRQFAQFREVVTKKALTHTDMSIAQPVVLWQDTCQLLKSIG